MRTEYVMVHDAARPLIGQDDLKKLALLVQKNIDGAILACKVSDTLKMVSDGKIIKTVPRENMYRAYTPQMFKTKLLKQALEHADKNHLAITDDASAMEVLGYEVLIVEGDSGNFKLTTPDDLNLAKLMIEKGNN